MVRASCVLGLRGLNKIKYLKALSYKIHAVYIYKHVSETQADVVDPKSWFIDLV